ncbi:MAG: radical SAM protein [Candidatus Sedimenticola sp. (ex Thyasira tokunagai)]
MSKLYSHLKFLAFPEQLQALSNQQVVAPVHIRIKPTNNCNHDCWYCAYHVDDLALGKEMDQHDSIPAEKMFEIVDDLVVMGVKAVTFSGGGEPLIYKPLPQVIERLAAGGVKIACLTNGSNLKGEVADAFATHGTWIRISLDGYDEASYSKARGVPEGSFAKLMANMSSFSSRHSGCVLGAAYIIDQQNHQGIYDVCSRLKDAGANHVKLSGVIVGNSVEENNVYHETIKEATWRQIEQARRLEDESFTLIDAYHDMDDRGWSKPYTNCPHLLFRPVIGADCGVYTCHDKAYTKEGMLGSIKETSFREFWMSEENRKQLYDFDPSISCHHHCVAHSSNLVLQEYLELNSEHMFFV